MRLPDYHDLMIFFHQKPTQVILGKIGIPVAGKTIIDQFNRRMLVQKLPRKIPFEEPVGMTMVANGHRSRSVVFRHAYIARTGP